MLNDQDAVFLNLISIAYNLSRNSKENTRKLVELLTKSNILKSELMTTMALKITFCPHSHWNIFVSLETDFYSREGIEVESH